MNTEQLKILLSFKESNKVCNIPQPVTEDKIKEEGKKIFGYEGASIIQYFDPDWDEYIDYNEDAIGKNKFKIVPSFNPTSIQHDTPVLIIDSNNSPSTSFEDINSQIQESNSSSSQIQWPNPFIITKSMLTTSLWSQLNESKQLSWTDKRTLVRDIANTIKLYTLYPTSEKYDQVARALVEQFPYLKETIGTGHSGWRQKIKDNMKNSRRLNDSPEVKAKKGKYGKRKVDIASDVDLNTDIAASKTELLSEAVKLKPNKRIIETNMQVTYNDRRKLIHENISVNDLQEQYPSLFTKNEIENEFRRVTGITNLYAKVEQWFKENGKQVITFLESKKNPNKDMLQFKKTLLQLCESSNITKDEKDIITSVILIPHLFKENHETFINIVEETASTNEVKNSLAPKGTIVGNPYLPNTRIIISAENCHLVTSTNIIETVSTVFALYFILNCKYPKSLMNTLSFMQHFVLKVKIANEKPPIKVISFVQKFLCTTDIPEINPDNTSS